MRRLLVQLEQIMRGKEGFACSLYRFAVTPFAWAYGAAIKMRNLFYDWKGGQEIGIPVVSVGNLVCGGTGKTDLACLLAEKLPGKVAIVSRGYGVKIKEPFVVQSHHGPELCGDEPRMMANRLPGCLVVVGPDRVAAAKLAKASGAEICVLDDGMQHRRLARDVDIVIEAEASHFLPKGIQRDDPKRMKKADLVVALDKKIGTGSCLVQSKIEGIFSLDGEKIETLQGESIALFCGIANPHRFVKTVEQLGARIEKTLFLADHEKAKEKELEALLKQSGAKYLVCTEKDQVKLKSSLPILWVKRRLWVDENAVSWQKALAKVGIML